jgi:hypothetical protein
LKELVRELKRQIDAIKMGEEEEEEADPDEKLFEGL